MRISDPRIILALDVDTIDEARNFADALYPKINIFKVGSHLFTAYGPAVVEMLRQKGAEVFLDLKYFDIPNTVAKAVSAAVRLNIKMFTLHIAGGREMIEAAVESAKKEADARSIVRPMLIGVTVLTSSNAASGDVLEMAAAGIDWGLDGVVCSAKEAEFLRGKIKKDFVIVTPGIRPDGHSGDDQKRVATVSEAVKAGSDFLVIGRPVLKADNPLAAAEGFLKDLTGLAG